MASRWGVAALLLLVAPPLPAHRTLGGSQFICLSADRPARGACGLAPGPVMSASADDDDWRGFRAKLVQGDREAHVPTEDTGPPTLVPSPPSPPPPTDGADGSYWVHELAVPEPGCLLLAQPHALLADQPVLHRAVVLVLEHDEECGTVGLLLDTPANATLGQLLKRRRDPRLQPLADNRLMIGGTVLPRQRLRVLTGRCDVPGSRKVLPGLYQCSLDAAARLVAIGAADASSFEIYAAACQWSPDQLAVELSQALWLPVAASSAAVRARPAGKHALYFQLMEAVGGQYLRQAMLARTGAEVDEWIARRTRSATGSLQRLADRVRGLETVNADEAALRIHGLLYPRDNLTDVSARTESLAEQAAYIWFTQELEAGTVLEPSPGGRLLPERPLKDPSALLPDSRSPKSAPRRRWRSAAGLGHVDAPSLRVLSAAAAGRVSKENALLAVNLLLFDLLNFRARPAGEALPEQTSLPDIIRRNGGDAGVLSLCILYASLARRLGIRLQLVRLKPPRAQRAPSFLLRLEPSTERQELYIDVLAGGRFRSLRDLGDYLRPGPGAQAEPAQLPLSQLRKLVVPLDSAALCLQLLQAHEMACLRADQLPQAAFWKLQRKMLKAHLAQGADEELTYPD